MLERQLRQQKQKAEVKRKLMINRKQEKKIALNFSQLQRSFVPQYILLINLEKHSTISIKPCWLIILLPLYRALQSLFRVQKMVLAIIKGKEDQQELQVWFVNFVCIYIFVVVVIDRFFFWGFQVIIYNRRCVIN